MALVTLEPPSPTPDQVGAPAPRRLAAGTELLGVYEAAAFTQPQFLLRRGDGQVIQLTRLLYLVAAALAAAPNATPAVIAAAVAVELDRPVSADNVTYIIDHKLAPLGVIAADDPAAVPLTQARPMLLGLRFRARVVPARLHRGLSRALRPLFWPPVVAAVLAALVGYDIWLGATRGAAILGGVQTVILHPDELLAIIAISVAVGFFHELGHATAARYGGATPGVMGVGIYLMMPVFYTDVTDSYRLGRRGRLRTDLGGLYFNAIAILAAAALYETTRSPSSSSSSASPRSRCSTSSSPSSAWTATTSSPTSSASPTSSPTWPPSSPASPAATPPPGTPASPNSHPEPATPSPPGSPPPSPSSPSTSRSPSSSPPASSPPSGPPPTPKPPGSPPPSAPQQSSPPPTTSSSSSSSPSPPPAWPTYSSPS